MIIGLETMQMKKQLRHLTLIALKAMMKSHKVTGMECKMHVFAMESMEALLQIIQRKKTKELHLGNAV